VGKQAKRINVEILSEAEKVVGKVQLRLLQVLSSATPVDTGFARAGWTPAVGTPATRRLDRPIDAEVAKKAAKTRAAENQAKATALAAAYKVTQGPAFMSNNVPYIVFLNEGSSAQAPAKFVERAIEQVVRSFGGSTI
jgi:hypothetical protein